MAGYTPSTYGDRIAEIYDEWYAATSGSSDVSAAVSFLRDAAGTGPALELGIGTGRIALPLQAASGIEVHGIDASEAMIERLRSKDGGERIPITVGDFRDFELGTPFRLIYVVFNTFFGLLAQDDQVSCFRAVSRHLSQDGVFVMEAFVPDLARFNRGQRVSAVRVEPDAVTLEVSDNDPLEQRTDSQQVLIRGEGVQLYPVKIRYAYISELDIMARLSGMTLRERWADWDRSPLSASSPKHISVWEPSG